MCAQDAQTCIKRACTCVCVFVSLSLFPSLSPYATHGLQADFSCDFSTWDHMAGIRMALLFSLLFCCVLHAGCNKPLPTPMFFWSILWDVLCSTSCCLTQTDNKNPRGLFSFLSFWGGHFYYCKHMFSKCTLQQIWYGLAIEHSPPLSYTDTLMAYF